MCIGAKIAPILSDIYLSRVDMKVENDLASCCMHIFRFVEDFLVLASSVNPEFVSNVLDVFARNGSGLRLTHEVPQETALQFLDLKLSFQPHHVCWQYSPRSEKPLLNYRSFHSKLVKSSIVTGCLGMAVKKSCHHKMMSSLLTQADKCREAGFLNSVLVSSADKVLCALKLSSSM